MIRNELVEAVLLENVLKARHRHEACAARRQIVCNRAEIGRRREIPISAPVLCLGDAAPYFLLGLGVNPDPLSYFLRGNPGHLIDQAVDILALAPRVGTDINRVDILSGQQSFHNFKLLFDLRNYLIAEFFRQKGQGVERPLLIARVVDLGIAHRDEMPHAPGHNAVTGLEVTVLPPTRNAEHARKLLRDTRFLRNKQPLQFVPSSSVKPPKR